MLYCYCKSQTLFGILYNINLTFLPVQVQVSRYSYPARKIEGDTARRVVLRINKELSSLQFYLGLNIWD